MLSEDEFDLLKRAVLALEMNAMHQKRVADHLDKQEESQSKFREVINSLAGDAEPTSDNGVDTTSLDQVEEATHVVDWFIDTSRKERPLMVKLSNGSIREPTTKEAAKIG